MVVTPYSHVLYTNMRQIAWRSIFTIVCNQGGGEVSLVPRLSGKRRAWYTLFAHVMGKSQRQIMWQQADHVAAGRPCGSRQTMCYVVCSRRQRSSSSIKLRSFWRAMSRGERGREGPVPSSLSRWVKSGRGKEKPQLAITHLWQWQMGTRLQQAPC